MKNNKLKRAEKLIKEGAKFWELGNNSGNNNLLNFYEAKSNDRYNTAEKLIKEVYPDVIIDYPGLYPCYNLKGFDFYSLESLEFHNEVTNE